jgi:UDP:flavonoid glycosyltransferase YjiC (YdhE family)
MLLGDGDPGCLMKILFVSWPGYGHLLPMVPLIRAAQRGGHDVLVSSGSDMTALIAQLGVDAHTSGLTAADGYARLPSGAVISQLPPEEQSTFAARHLFGAGAVDRARDLLELFESWRPDLVVHDTLELGSAIAAERSDIVHVTHGYGPRFPDNARIVEAIGPAIEDAGFADPTAAVFVAPYLDISPPGLLGSPSDRWRDLRPLRPSAGEVPADTDLPSRIAALPHAESVYVTLGTVMNQAPDIFRAVIQGCSRLPVNLVVTTGPGFDASLLGPARSTVLSAPFIPQAAVLPHCAAVISHAGSGTLLGALCHGLPQLCLPQGTDQPFNAAALASTGGGLVLQPEVTTADSVMAAVERLLREPSFRHAAQRLRDEIDEMPEAELVLQALS